MACSPRATVTTDRNDAAETQQLRADLEVRAFRCRDADIEADLVVVEHEAHHASMPGELLVLPHGQRGLVRDGGQDAGQRGALGAADEQNLAGAEIFEPAG